MLELREVKPDQQSGRLSEVIERLVTVRAAARWLSVDEARHQVEDMVERMKDEADLLDVVDGDDRVGLLWWGRDGNDSVVLDLVLDEPERAAELLPLLLARARADGSSRVGVGVSPAAASRTALAALPGFVSRATNMALPLDGDLPEAGGVELRRMTEEEFAAFHARLVDGYGADIAASSGLTAEEGRARSQEQVSGLIPQGLESPGMEFFTAWHEVRPVGLLWLFTGDPMAFVYDVEVRTEEQRKGYGAGIMNAGARWSREHGHPSIGLNVFAHNPGARALYDKLGYQVTLDYRTLDVADA